MYHNNTKTINNDTSANNNNLNTKSHHHNSKTHRTLNQFKEYIFNNEWFSTFKIKIVYEFTSWEKITEWNLSEHYMLAFLINMLFLFGHESEFVSLISSSLERIIRKSTYFRNSQLILSIRSLSALQNVNEDIILENFQSFYSNSILFLQNECVTIQDMIETANQRYFISVEEEKQKVLSRFVNLIISNLSNRYKIFSKLVSKKDPNLVGEGNLLPDSVSFESKLKNP